MYKEMESNTNAELLLQHQQREISSEGYFGYSVQLLLSLYRASPAKRQILPSPAQEVTTQAEV